MGGTWRMMLLLVAKWRPSLWGTFTLVSGSQFASCGTLPPESETSTTSVLEISKWQVGHATLEQATQRKHRLCWTVWLLYCVDLCSIFSGIVLFFVRFQGQTKPRYPWSDRSPTGPAKRFYSQQLGCAPAGVARSPASRWGLAKLRVAAKHWLLEAIETKALPHKLCFTKPTNLCNRFTSCDPANLR